MVLQDFWASALARPFIFLCNTPALQSPRFNTDANLWFSKADGDQMLVTNQTSVLAAYGS